MTAKAIPIHSLNKRKANRAQTAEFFDVTPPSLDGWVRRGCPVVQRGSRGISWVFDLLQVAEWRFGGMGAVPVGDDPESLSPKERLDFYRGTREKTRHLQECAELMTTATYQAQLSSVLKLVAVTIESLPDVLERDAGISGLAVERAQLVCDRVRESLYKQLLELTHATEAKPD